MKKQQYFSDLVGFILLAAVLVGVFTLVSKPKPKEEISLPEISQEPLEITPEALEPKVTPAVIKPPVEPEKPKPAVVTSAPKPKTVTPAPAAVVVAPKPKAPEKKIVTEAAKPKVTEKKIVAIAPKSKPEPQPKPEPEPQPKPKSPLRIPFFKPKPKPQPIEEKGKIAIVIDDWGYNLDNMAVTAKIKYPFTAAVLPNLAYSKQAANKLHSYGVEIILHLPMQPKGDNNLEKNTIKTSMDEAEIKEIVNRDLDSLNFAKGASNHMGSQATEDPRVMEAVFQVLKDRHLYFLDSFVTPKTVCITAANKMHIGVARRDIFLDNKDDPEYIKEQVYKLRDEAKERGQAIGIGHDRRRTMEVLKEIMPELAKEGFRFVRLSELIKQ